MFPSRCIILLFVYVHALVCNGGKLNRRLDGDDKSLIREVKQLLGELRDVEDHGEAFKQEKRVVPIKKASAYVNGVIYTVNPNIMHWQDHPAQAIVIEDGVITYVGSDDGADKRILELLDLYVDCSVFDLERRVVLPGLHDVHMHPLEAGTVVGGGCQLPSNTAPTDSVMTDSLAYCPWLATDGGTDWVLGGGHSITNILEHIQNGGKSPREILDDAIPNKPAIMLEETSHSCWVNSLALKLAGIDNTTPEKPGGIIMRGKNNEPNGILFENAVISIMDQALKPNTELDKITYDGLKWSLQLLAKNGITSVCDARSYWKRGHDKIWQKACTDDKLTVRAVLSMWAYPDENDAQQIQKLKDMYSQSSASCNNLLRKTQIKVYSDGLLESTTAAMLKKYVKNLHLPNNDANVGMNYFTEDRLAKYITELQQLDGAGNTGYDFHVHTIGDRGVRETLNAIDTSYSGGRQSRHRLTHVEVVDPADIGRFADLDVIADFQVAGEFTLPEFSEEHVASLIGPIRAKNFIPVRSIKDTGATTTFSSDWDVSGINPFLGLQHALQRGDQSVTLPEAIEMYTIYPAYVMRQEDKVGSLQIGKAADLIVIDQDIFKIPVEKISATKVLKTLLNGKEVYSSATKLPDITSYYYY